MLSRVRTPALSQSVGQSAISIVILSLYVSLFLTLSDPPHRSEREKKGEREIKGE
jgi:hypothetical protein